MPLGIRTTRIVVATVLVVALGLLAPPAHAQGACGDLDDSGTITIADAQRALVELVSHVTHDGQVDVSGDGRFTVLDVLWLLYNAVYGEPLLDCPVFLTVTLREGFGSINALHIGFFTTYWPLFDPCLPGDACDADSDANYAQPKCTSHYGDPFGASTLFLVDSVIGGTFSMAFVATQSVAGPVELFRCSVKKPRDEEGDIENHFADACYWPDVQTTPVQYPAEWGVDAIAVEVVE